jgi:hypothetical protein
VQHSRKPRIRVSYGTAAVDHDFGSDALLNAGTQVTLHSTSLVNNSPIRYGTMQSFSGEHMSSETTFSLILRDPPFPPSPT